MSGVLQSVKNTFDDSKFIVYNNADDTKKIDFDLSGITTGNTRTITWPDRDFDFTNPVFDGNIHRHADGCIDYYGVDDDVSLTHIADTGLVLNKWLSVGKTTFKTHNTGQSVLQIGGNGVLSCHTAEGGGQTLSFSENAYEDHTDSRWEAIATGLSCLYQQTAGKHYFYVSNGSDNADAVIDWITPFAIQNDGSIDLGTNRIGNDGSAAGAASFDASNNLTLGAALTVNGLTASTVIYSDATKKITSLTNDVPAATFMNYLGLANGNTLAGYKALFDATVPGTIAAGAGAAAGTATVSARRDHTHGAPATWAATAHDIFSATHGDTTGAASPVDGDVIIGNATPKWSKLAISIPAANVRNVIGVDNGELRPSWKTALDGTSPETIAAGGAGQAGTSLVFSHRDHNHPAPATWAATAHALLSTTHSDVTASAVARGSIVTGQGVSPTWTQLVKGSAYAVLTGDGTDTAWSAFLLAGTSGGKTTFAVTNTKTLTLTATDDFNLTIPATGTAALGTGTSTHVAYWNGTNTITGSANMTFDGTNLTVAGDATVGDDLILNSDGAIISLGLHGEVYLTHVHNTGLLLNGAMDFQFGDSGTYIHQSSDGVLDFVSDTTARVMIGASAELTVNSTLATFLHSVTVTQDLSIAKSLAVQGGGVLAAGEGFVDAATARASPDSVAGRHIITVAPSADATCYYALSDKVDGQMVVVENIGSVYAHVDGDETRSMFITPGYTFMGFWDATTDKWYGVHAQQSAPS